MVKATALLLSAPVVHAIICFHVLLGRGGRKYRSGNVRLVPAGSRAVRYRLHQERSLLALGGAKGTSRADGRAKDGCADGGTAVGKVGVNKRRPTA